MNEGKGRIIALRVSDADFEILDGLKRAKGLGWNQLLLEPVMVVYEVNLDSVQPLRTGKGAGKAEAPAKGTEPKQRKSKKAKPPVEEILEDKGLEVTLSGDVVEPHM